MMNRSVLRRTALALAVSFAGVSIVRAEDPQQVASVETLKNEAFKALRGGQFDRTNQLLGQAASLSNDPTLAKMSQWISQFESEHEVLVSERQKECDKAAADVQTLLKNDYEDAAIDRAKDAYLLSSDKEAFLKQQWMSDLMKRAREDAKQDEASGDWIKAQRMYTDLSAVEPGVVEWKNKFKAVTGRLRLLVMYTPEQFKKTIDVEVKRRETADKLINPTTQPATQPAPEDNDSFKTDWHDTLHGVQMDMLVDALDDARANYWRDVSYKTLTDGGLVSLKNLASTRGLDQAFPALTDDVKRQAFLDAIDRATDQMNHSDPDQEGRTMRKILDAISSTNESTLNLPSEVIVNEFAEGAFGQLDPFSVMIWPSDLEDFNKITQGEFSGVGIEIKLDEEGNLKVVSPLEDAPAYKLGIAADDLITRINGKNAKGININQAVKNITGPSGTFVTLTIKTPSGSEKDYTIRRETIHVASVKGYQHKPGGGWDWYVDPDQRIGYVRITNFAKTTDEELGHAITDMEHSGARAIILDLRNDPGGLLTAATEVCDRFLSGGIIVSTRGDRDLPAQEPMRAHPGDETDLPVIVLVNQLSASASEIVSGALQDDHRALIVGERTFGKGSVQMLFPLSARAAALKLTTSHYYLPSGRTIHKDDNSTTWGVDPDVKIEMTGEQMRAAQEARIGLEVLRENNADVTDQTAKAGISPTTAPAVKKDLLAVDPQLSAAVLLLRLQLAGGNVMTEQAQAAQ